MLHVLRPGASFRSDPTRGTHYVLQSVDVPLPPKKKLTPGLKFIFVLQTLNAAVFV